MWLVRYDLCDPSPACGCQCPFICYFLGLKPSQAACRITLSMITASTSGIPLGIQIQCLERTHKEISNLPVATPKILPRKEIYKIVTDCLLCSQAWRSQQRRSCCGPKDCEIMVPKYSLTTNSGIYTDGLVINKDKILPAVCPYTDMASFQSQHG